VKRETGYTLLELLVVMAVMALIAAAIPGMALPGIGGVRLSGRVEEEAYRLQRARGRAIETGKTIVMHIANGMNGSQLVSDQSGEFSEIRFFPDGSDSGGAVAVTLGGHSRILLVDPITGRVTAR